MISTELGSKGEQSFFFIAGEGERTILWGFKWFSGGNGGGMSRRQQSMKGNYTNWTAN